MESIQVMMNEHQQILRVLEALECFAAAVGDAPADKLALGRFIKFVREYADERHHGKEENVLFTAMMRNGFPPEAGPVGMMLQEHQQMRALVSELRGLAQQDAPWGASGRERVSDLANAYVSELREHIMKEDEMLYPMAMEHLPPPVQEQVDVECADLDARRASAGSDAVLEELARELVEQYASGAQRTG